MRVFKESIGTVLDIDTLLDMLNGETISDVADAITNRKQDGYSSIAARAKDLTATFPILISNRVSLKTAEKIAKALEFKYALMLQMVIASKSFTTSKDAVDFLKNYHTNIDAHTYGSFISKFASTEEAYIAYLKASKIINESFQQKNILSEYGKPMKINVFQEARDQAFVRIDNNSIRVGNEKYVKSKYLDNQTKANQIEKDRKDLQLRAKDKKIEDLKKSMQDEKEKHKQDFQNQQDRFNKELQDKLNDVTPLRRPQLNDQKVRKANALNPLTMNVNFKVKATDQAVVTVEAMIGVKTKLYPVDSMEILDRIYSDRDTKINLFNFIRAFSGEIQFWRDFVFALSKAKIDANFNARKVGSKLWKVLERRSKTSKLSQMLNINNSATAITTLVLSSEEAGFLNKEYDIDLLDSAVARKLLDDFNFISIMIVDENLETIRTIMDTGSDEWECNTFKAFERDEEMDYKQMVKMLAKAY